jgi:spermidine dehydrogenase
MTDKDNRKQDRDLGMSCPITRRDFLNGVALGVGGVLAAPHLASALDSPAFAPEKAPEYYPPALMGMRGNHDGTSTFAHKLRDGKFAGSAPNPESTGETYDLIVVGGGISGLSAAHFYRKSAGSNTRILILDNHDDFGGHAKRNEFRRVALLSNGGPSIESPSRYSDVAKGGYGSWDRDEKFYKAYDQSCIVHEVGTFLLTGRLRRGSFVAGMGEVHGSLPKRPFGTRPRDIARLTGVDYLRPLRTEARPAGQSATPISHHDRKECTRTSSLFSNPTHDLFAVGDAVPALYRYESGDDYDIGYPGFSGTFEKCPKQRREGRPTYFIFLTETLPSPACWCAP